jgi:hypothetical protein
VGILAHSGEPYTSVLGTSPWAGKLVLLSRVYKRSAACNIQSLCNGNNLCGKWRALMEMGAPTALPAA